MDPALVLLEILEACLSSQRSVEGTAEVEIHEELNFMSSNIAPRSPKVLSRST